MPIDTKDKLKDEDTNVNADPEYGKRKEFDKELHDAVDKRTREAVIAMLEKGMPSLTHINNPFKFGIDVLSLDTDKNVVHAWEVENRTTFWLPEHPTFPANTISCLGRKVKLMRYWRSGVHHFKVLPTAKAYYVQTRSDTHSCIILSETSILEKEHDLVEVENKTGTVGEKMLYISTSKGTHFLMSEAVRLKDLEKKAQGNS